MPLEEALRTKIDGYCRRDLPGDLQWHVEQFAFIEDDELRKRLGRAFYSARYVAKLMEALFVSGDVVHPFVKFQIMQYASIYEADITNLLWSRYGSHPEVKSLETHKAFKPVRALASVTTVRYGEENVHMCVYRDEKTRRSSIAFKDKVDCAVRIGFVEERYAGDIKRTYELRNLAHIETEAKKQVEIEVENAKAGYWRLKPFLERIVEHLRGEPA